MPYRLLVKNNQTYVYPEPNGYWVMGRNFAAIEDHEGISNWRLTVAVIISLAIIVVVLATIVKLCRVCYSRVEASSRDGQFEVTEETDINESLVNTEVVYGDYDTMSIGGGCQPLIQDSTSV